jgi:galactokinase
MEDVIKKFVDAFGSQPKYVSRAPGRVNLIGEHTDYNGGFVLPMAIDRCINVAFTPVDDGRVVVDSLDMCEMMERATDESFAKAGNWRDYVSGSLEVVKEKGVKVPGMRAVMAGDVPQGAGLSSSAALEVAFVNAFLSAAGAEWKPIDVIKAAQRAENKYVGVMCGIMDQYVSVFGEADKAILLDCRSLTHRLVPVKHEEVSIVVLDTGVKHNLGAGPYNERRASCEEAATMILGHSSLLRDVTTQVLEANKSKLGEKRYKRARHVITENERTGRAVKALEKGDYTLFGALMYASHNSLRNDFEVSCEELDVMVNTARAFFGKHPGTGYGARMTGGGFGGCTVNLVVPGQEDEFMTAVLDAYAKKTGNSGRGWTFRPSQGARIESVK